MIGFKFAPVCEVCGCHGPKRCARCHNAYYCSREHQEEDWRVGHSDICKKIQAWKKEHGLENATELPKSAELPTFQKYPSHFLFKEMEVITDLEPGVATGVHSLSSSIPFVLLLISFVIILFAEKDLPDIEKKGLMSKYNDYLKNWTKKDNAELNDDFKSGPSDKTFSKFHNRLSRDPEQILRFFSLPPPCASFFHCVIVRFLDFPNFLESKFKILILNFGAIFPKAFLLLTSPLVSLPPFLPPLPLMRL